MNRKLLLINDNTFESLLLTNELGNSRFELMVYEKASDCDVSAIQSFDPDVVIINLSFNHLEMFSLLKILRSWKSGLGIVMISDCSDLRLFGLDEADIPVGANLILRKSVTHIYVLQQAIFAAMDGAISMEKFRWLQGPGSTNQAAWSSKFSNFSAIQIETLRLVASGMSNHEIADFREVSEKSVEHIIRRIVLLLKLTTPSNLNVRVRMAQIFYETAGIRRS